MREEDRWRHTTKGEVQFRKQNETCNTRFWIRPRTIGVEGAGMGLFAAKEYKRQGITWRYIWDRTRGVPKTP